MSVFSFLDNRPKPTAPEADAIAQANMRASAAEAETARLRKALEYLNGLPEDRDFAWVREFSRAMLTRESLGGYYHMVYTRGIWPDSAFCGSCGQQTAPKPAPKPKTARRAA